MTGVQTCALPILLIGRSSMEALILTCLQSQLIAGRVYKQDLPKQAKNDLIWEIKQISPKECKIDAKAD